MYKPYGLSALSFKILKPYGFKAFPDVSHTLWSQTKKQLCKYVYVCVCVYRNLIEVIIMTR